MKKIIFPLLSVANIRWTAVIFLFAGYLLVSNGLISGQGIVFNAINIFGAVLLIASSLWMKPKDWPVAVFNMIWLVFAIIAIFKVVTQ